ncbi:hypothetical protein I3760_15G118100 [Carya illinoinensis]|nr:hypothetical protein I3760_15G118100 [Carya illinoinensis]
MVEDDSCPICNREVETMGHAIWSCEAARDVWAENASPLRKWSCSDESLSEVWERIIQKLPKLEVEMVAVSMRKIWLRRNKLIFEEQFTGPKCLISQAIEDMEEYREAQRVGEVNRQSVIAGGREVKWKRPGENIVKINWDVAYDQKSLKMGAGVVIRDEEGEVLTCLSVEVCTKLRFLNFEFEGDALTIVNDVNNRDENWAWYGQIVDNLRSIFSGVSSWKLKHIYREGNKVAHSLAKKAIGLDEEIVWMEDCLEEVFSRVLFDKHVTNGDSE